ncbi:MaoC/PaaZ C-terminal domain-containing protein [Marinobacter sp.]|uniref:MaoC/PaaZ C-terminal domain-containing protein n=1 Tax=Marinobacter sp. TaxID=50741 RepID=UPI0034A580BD
MPDTTIYQNTPPSLWSLYGKAILPGRQRPSGDLTIPDMRARLTGVSTANDNLKRYQRVCGFSAQTTSAPITWPHILAFPLHLKLLTEKAFPLPLLGLVHLNNTITQHRPVAIGEILDIDVRLDGEKQGPKGLEFDLVTEARSAGKMIWEETSTFLFRQAQSGSSTGKTPPPELERFPNTLNITAAESIGRQYANVSGDRNPIHLHAWTAKAFGFPRAIAHGMWSKAQALACLEQQPDWNGHGVTASCQFKKPLFLPGTAQLNWKTGSKGWDYQLLNAKGDAPHLTGEVRWG